jgi:exopolyphosphatase/guanosine-5'-triphosphate,3'-diphosphate pyrophosphatase
VSELEAPQRISRTVGRRRPVAIVDIGSNSMRLVVYDGLTRTPIPMFNEKVMCALGQGLLGSGRLNPEGVPSAHDGLARFVGLAKAMKVAWIDILATAAIRDAEDGPAFVLEAERRNKIRLDVLSGEDEARLAAQGIFCGVPDAQGVVADLGGGSMDLVEVGEGEFGAVASLPLGVLRLAEASGNDRERAKKLIDQYLSELSWLKRIEGKTLYAVGGAWRALARAAMIQTNYPLIIIDNYALASGEAVNLMNLFAQQSRKSLEKFSGISKKRLATLPLAALLLARLIQAARPASVKFSVYGLREGRFFERLPAHLKKEDPLLSACRRYARTASRFTADSAEMMHWLAHLFPSETPSEKRLRHAACKLGDSFWHEHPDYRAEQAFLRVLRLPIMGLEHSDRVFLALTLHARYNGEDNAPITLSVRRLLDEAATKRAIVLGAAMRLGYLLSAGSPGVVSHSKLKIKKGRVILEIPDGDPIYTREAIDKPLEKLTKLLDCSGADIRTLAQKSRQV